jgi:inner membrane protein involved in colicin E2 resistance
MKYYGQKCSGVNEELAHVLQVSPVGIDLILFYVLSLIPIVA